MAEEHKAKKRKPRKITTSRHDDGSYSHEHMHDDGKHSMFAGTSQNVEDVQQHMADHFGGGAPAEGGEEPEPAAEPAAAAAGAPQE